MHEAAALGLRDPSPLPPTQVRARVKDIGTLPPRYNTQKALAIMPSCPSHLRRAPCAGGSTRRTVILHGRHYACIVCIGRDSNRHLTPLCQRVYTESRQF